MRPVVELFRRLLGLEGKDDDPGVARDEDAVCALDEEPAPEPEPEPEEGPVGGRAGSAADAGGVDERDLGPGLEELEPEVAWVVLDEPPMVGWNGRDIDDNFDPLPLVAPLLLAVVDVDVDAEVDAAFSSTSIFSVSSSTTGTVAFGSMGNLRSRQFLTRSVIWVKMSTRPWAVSWYSFNAALCSSKLWRSVTIRLHNISTIIRHPDPALYGSPSDIKLTHRALACSFPGRRSSLRSHHI